MLTFHATEEINKVSRTRTTTQVITRYLGCWLQTTIKIEKSACAWDLHLGPQEALMKPPETIF